jgi:uncharacterized protein (TIGR03083 family)
MVCAVVFQAPLGAYQSPVERISLMDTLTQRVILVRTEAERLQDYLGTLSPAAWHHASVCAGWEVGDVVAYLTRGAEAYVEWITRGLHGDMAPPPRSPAADMENMAARSVHRAQRAIAIRISLGDQLFPTFQACTAQFTAFLEGLTTQDWERPCYHPTGLHPARRFELDLYISELAMHGWDMRSQLEPVAHLSDESLPVFLDLVPNLNIVHWTFRPGPRLPGFIRYHFVLINRVSHVYDIIVTGDQAWLAQAGTDTAHSTCQSNTETFVLLMFGCLSLPGAIAEGRIHMEGIRESITAFAQWFRGI